MATKSALISDVADLWLLEVIAYKTCQTFLSGEDCSPCLSRLSHIWKHLLALQPNHPSFGSWYMLIELIIQSYESKNENVFLKLKQLYPEQLSHLLKKTSSTYPDELNFKNLQKHLASYVADSLKKMGRPKLYDLISAILEEKETPAEITQNPSTTQTTTTDDPATDLPGSSSSADHQCTRVTPADDQEENDSDADERISWLSKKSAAKKPTLIRTPVRDTRSKSTKEQKLSEQIEVPKFSNRALNNFFPVEEGESQLNQSGASNEERSSQDSDPFPPRNAKPLAKVYPVRPKYSIPHLVVSPSHHRKNQGSLRAKPSPSILEIANEDDCRAARKRMRAGSSGGEKAATKPKKVVRSKGADESGESLVWDSSSEEEKRRPYRSLRNTNGQGKQQTRVRVKFTSAEEGYLVSGVECYGVGNWSTILKNYDFQTSRTNVSLKDKYRTMKKQGFF